MRVKNNNLRILVIGILSLIFFTGCGSDIDIIKNGVMDDYKSLTVGNAMDNWKECDNKEWEAYETENGERVVRFICYRTDMSNYYDINAYMQSKVITGDPLEVPAMEAGEATIKKSQKFLKILTINRMVNALYKLYKFDKNKVFDYESMTSEFQWTINVDESFELTFSETVTVWKDEKIFNSGHLDGLIDDVYNNDYTIDLESIREDEYYNGLNDSEYYTALILGLAPIYIEAK